jgi:hypothetical protein
VCWAAPIHTAIEGGDVSLDAMAAWAERLGNPADLQMIVNAVEEEGGQPSIAEKLAMLDACEAGELPFTRLVEARDLMLSTLRDDLAEMMRAVPTLAPVLLAVSDPALSPQFIAMSALDSVTVEWSAGRASGGRNGGRVPAGSLNHGDGTPVNELGE